MDHAKEWMIFDENIGSHVGLDETSLSKGELYTILINKQAKGKKGSIIAMIKGTDASYISKILMKISRKKRFQVREITLDLSPSMAQIARVCFPSAKQVVDRFHVQKLAYDAVQDIRIEERWKAIDQENNEIAYAKACGIKYKPFVFENGDSRKQLLARSRYILFKKETAWNTSQRIRAAILFREYPKLKKAYYLSMQLGLIYSKAKDKTIALTRLAQWYEKVDQSGFMHLGTLSRTIQMHYQRILNFFNHRATNAASESFNAKIKLFRTKLRGVRDINFFLYRLANIYA